MSVVTGRPVRALDRRRASRSPSSQPGPAERLARRAVGLVERRLEDQRHARAARPARRSVSAMASVRSCDSMTHGPAIHNSGDPPPQRRPAISTGRMAAPWESYERSGNEFGRWLGMLYARAAQRRERCSGLGVLGYPSRPAAIVESVLFDCGRPVTRAMERRDRNRISPGILACWDSIPTHGLPACRLDRKKRIFIFLSRRLRSPAIGVTPSSRSNGLAARVQNRATPRHKPPRVA